MSESVLAAIAALVLGAGLFAGVVYVWRTRLQLCPHCGWIVPRVERGWRRCARCHKQYARQGRRRPH